MISSSFLSTGRLRRAVLNAVFAAAMFLAHVAGAAPVEDPSTAR